MSSAESVTEYASRVRRLVSKAKAALSNEFGEENINTYTPIVTAAGLNSFLRGLRPDLEIRVAIGKPATLETAIEMARDEERRAADRGAYRDPSSAAFPRPFQPSGHPMMSRPHSSSFSPPHPQGANKNNFWIPGALPPRPTNFRDGESNRPFMNPRNPHHYQPPVPRYGDLHCHHDPLISAMANRIARS